MSEDLEYALGWSNGGYMVTHAAASVSAASSDGGAGGAPLFRAIAPIAGYQYNNITSLHPIGIFQHHSINDPAVHF